MKKIIKIFILVLFITLFLGITTSNALDVYEDTEKSALESALKRNEKLYFKENSYLIMAENANIFCRQKGAALGNYETIYQIDGAKITYPGSEKNGYAIAYIFEHGKNAGYSKSDIQKAYWNLLDNPTYNIDQTYVDAIKLRDIGKAYQSFKNTEKNFTVNTANAKTETSGNFVIYGPITIDYSYVYSNGEQFGGFNFSFSGANNINTSNVQLCKKEGSTYKNIDNDNNRKIRTSAYNGMDLYVKINLNEINVEKLNMEIKYNGLDVSSTVYPIKGVTAFTGTKRVYCMECEEKIEYIDGTYTQVSTDKFIGYKEKYWRFDSKSPTLNKIDYDDVISTAGKLRYEKYLFEYNNSFYIAFGDSVAETYKISCLSGCSISLDGKIYGDYEKVLEVTAGHVRDHHIKNGSCELCGSEIRICNIREI